VFGAAVGGGDLKDRIDAVSMSALSRRLTSKPSMSGSLTSSMIKSGASARARRSASIPVSASITRKPACRSVRPMA